MPELPEVETIKMDLEKAVVGATISDFSSNSPKQIIPSMESVKKAVMGAKIVGVERRAKLIILRLQRFYSSSPSAALGVNSARSSRPAKRDSNSNHQYLAIHLKMTGRLLLRKKGETADPFARAVFTLQKRPDLQASRSGLSELRFCDTRKFGYIRLFRNKKELDNFLKDFGPEPFSQDFTIQFLQKVLSKKSRSIKTCLMDQSLISGIGNIYANEALYLAGILPIRPAKSLKFKEFKSLKESIITVLKKGIAYRGSTARDESYRDLYGELGHYQNHFLVYQKQRCQKCQSVIKYQKISGRGTFWCQKCQR